MYIGIANGGHYFGFNNETNEWESVSVFSYDGQPTPADLAAPLDDLMTWLTRIYPGEPLVTYGLNDPGMN